VHGLHAVRAGLPGRGHLAARRVAVSATGSVVLVGVGGQGVVLASAILADVAVRSHYDVKQSEVHGMSQRGGVVSSFVRFGPEVRSPLIGAGQADVVVAFEWNEGLRALTLLRPGGTLIVDLGRIVPPGALRDRRSGRADYPALELRAIPPSVSDVRAVDAVALAARAGNAKAMSAVMLGVLAPLLPFAPETWRAAVDAAVPPRTRTVNEHAFLAGQGLRYPEETGRLALGLPPATAVHVRPAARLEIVERWCKGERCAICVRVCPERCLAIGSADAVVVRAPEACTGCRLCEIFCPDFAITVRRGGPLVPA
jgi:indolepyruvate ferredoxin oxidoreductase, beta subunit